MSEELAVYNAEPEEVEIITPITNNTLVELAEQAEKRIDAMNKVKRVAIKLTNPHDWTDQGGKPYLQVSGAEKIARMFGVSWRISEPTKDSFEGGHYSFTYKGYFSLAGATIEAIGTRSSKDGFFKKYGYDNGTKTELPASEIDPGDVKKSAYTNCIGNGITRLLGIRNLTYEDLAEFAGITKEQIAKVGYKKDGKQQEGIASEGAQTVTIAVSDVRKKDGKSKAGKDFTIYTIKNGNAEYTTFDTKLAQIAKDSKDIGAQVQIVYTTDKFGNKIESLLVVQPEADREPGVKE